MPRSLSCLRTTGKLLCLLSRCLSLSLDLGLKGLVHITAISSPCFHSTETVTLTVTVRGVMSAPLTAKPITTVLVGVCSGKKFDFQHTVGDSDALCQLANSHWHHHITSSRRMQVYWPLYPMNNLMYIKSIITHSLKLQYYGFPVVKVDRRIRWHYTTTIIRLRIGARLTRYRNCKFHNGCCTISRHADGIS